MSERFRKKPVVVEAMRVGVQNQLDVLNWMEASPPDDEEVRTAYLAVGGIIIFTLEGEMLAGPGDWIIKGVQGKFYPCKPDIFDQTYERVDDSEQGRA